jgi:hypothetical protein
MKILLEPLNEVFTREVRGKIYPVATDRTLKTFSDVSWQVRTALREEWKMIDE